MMGKYIHDLTLKIRKGAYDEHLERMFDATLALAVLFLFTALLAMYQLGCFEFYSPVLKPVPGLEWQVFPN
jgi:hypothetical protein